MTLKERVKSLCKERGVSMNQTETDLGFGKGYISKLGSSKPNTEKLNRMAEYFGVTLDYLMNGESNGSSDELTRKDERDIAKDMEQLRSKLMSGENGPLSFDGEPVSNEDVELLLGQIELMMHRLKPINKEKYNPNKNKNVGVCN